MFGLVTFVLGMLKDFAASAWSAVSGDVTPEAAASAGHGADAGAQDTAQVADAVASEASTSAFAANDNMAHLYGANALQGYLHQNIEDSVAAGPAAADVYHVAGFLESPLFLEGPAFDGQAVSLADAFSALQRANALFGDANDDVQIVAISDTSDGAVFAYRSTYDVPFS